MAPWPAQPRLESIRRIVVVRALFLGDFLAATPALRALRRALPHVEITLVGRPWMQDVWGRYTTIDRFLPFPGEPVWPPTPAWAEFATTARADGYDLALQWHGLMPPDFVCSLGARLTAGLCAPERCADLDVPTPFKPQHEILRLLRVVESLGLPTCGTQMELPILPEDRAAAEALLPGRRRSRPLVVLHAGARLPQRSWPAADFAAVADELGRRTGATVVLVGSLVDRAVSDDVLGRARCPMIDLVGRTNLGVLGALIAAADLFIGNDSGPAHLATALDTPSLVLFRRCMVGEWAPLNTTSHRPLFRAVPCPACDRWTTTGHRCLEAVRPAEVIAQAEDLLALRPRALGRRAADRER